MDSSSMMFLVTCLIVGIVGGQGFLLLKPSYESEWTSIEAQSEKAEIVFYHGLNSLPMKVVAEVKVVLRDGKTYIFDSVGTAQVNDNLDIPYGGVVSLYNETHVIVYAPSSSHGTGSVSFVGGAAWSGNLKDYVQTSEMPKSGYVRVKAWSHQDFPSPNFMQTSVPISVQDDDGYMRSFAHGIGKYPDYVVVQIRGASSGLISEAQGSVSILDHYNDKSVVSGVVFGYSPRFINVWAPGKNTAHPLRRVALFKVDKGWGNGDNAVEETSGVLTIRAWAFRSNADKEFLADKPNFNTQHNPRSPNCKILSNCLYSMEVQVTKGLYNEFRFRSVGSVVNNGKFGRTSGFLFAYNQDVFYLWKPILESSGITEGFFVSISGRWGNSSTQQTVELKDVDFHLGLWQQFSMRDIQCKNDTQRFQNIANASTAVSSEFYNSTLTMTCDYGFKRTAGNVSVTCDRNGMWKGSPIQCQLITCPGEVGNSSIQNGWSYSDGVYLGNTTTSMCNTGYKLVDPSSGYRVCLENETWTNADPICIEDIHCNDDTLRFQNIANASTALSSQSYNSTLTMTCNYGFKRTAGNVSVLCGINGMWNGSPIKCQLIICPGEIGNSSIQNGWSYSDGVYLGNTTISMCDIGYKLEDPSSRYRVCLENETWTNTDPICLEDIQCNGDTQRFQNIANASTAVSSQSYNSTMTMVCNYGFKRTAGNVSVTCGRNGKWNGSPIECQLITCPGEAGNSSIPNGWSFSDGVCLGNTTISKCNIGYYLVAPSSGYRVCLENETWSNTDPICSRYYYCDCTKQNNVMLNVSLEEELKKIIKELKVDKQKTSLNRRSKISVYEDRPSAKGLGVVGCLLLVGILSIIVVPDILKLISHIKSSLQRKSCSRQNSGIETKP